MQKITANWLMVKSDKICKLKAYGYFSLWMLMLFLVIFTAFNCSFGLWFYIYKQEGQLPWEFSLTFFFLSCLLSLYYLALACLLFFINNKKSVGLWHLICIPAFPLYPVLLLIIFLSMEYQIDFKRMRVKGRETVLCSTTTEMAKRGRENCQTKINLE